MATLSLLLFLVWWVLGTEQGTRWIIAQATGHESIRLDADTASGTLLTSIRLPRVSWEDSEREIILQGVSLEIDWPLTRPSRLAIERLTIESAAVTTPQESETKRVALEVSIPPLPFRLSLQNAVVNELQMNGHTLELLEIVQLQIHGHDIQATRVSAASGGHSTELSEISIQATGDVPVSGAFTWQMARPEWSGRGRLQGSLKRLQLSHELAGEFTVISNGTIELLHQTEPVVNLVNQFQDIAYQEWRTDKGTVRVVGTREDFHLEIDARVSSNQVPEFAIAGSASGNLRQFRHLDLTAVSSLATLRAMGTLAWSPQLAIELDLDIRGLDPSKIANVPSGSLNARAHLEAEGDTSFRAQVTMLDGTWQGKAVDGSGALSRWDRNWRCGECRIELGDNRLQVDGHLQGRILDGEVDIDAPSLAQLWPNLKGALEARGRLGGTLSLPLLSGTAKGSELGFRDWHAASLSVESRASTAEAIDLTLKVSSLHQAELALGDVSATVDGNLQEISLEMDWARDAWSSSMQAHLALEGETLKGAIAAAQVRTPWAGDWTLDQPTTILISPQIDQLGPATWSHGQAVLRHEPITRVQNNLALAVTLTDLPLNLVDAITPSGVHADGKADAAMKLELSPAGWNGRIDWLQRDTVLCFKGTDEEEYQGRIPKASWSADIVDSETTVRARIESEQGTTASLHAWLSEIGMDAELRARLKMSGDQWLWMPRLFPDIDQFDGAIGMDLTAAGTLASPRIQGQVKWTEGSIAVPLLNHSFSDVDLSIDGNDSGDMTVTGSARSGPGALQVSGQLMDVFSGSPVFDLKVSGQAATLLDWEDYRLVASPDLTFSGSLDQIRLGGSIQLDEAEIVVRELPEGVIEPSADFFVDGREPTVHRRTKIAGEARVTLGDAVHIRAFGLDTHVAGQLRFMVPENRDPQGFGVLRLVDGVFQAYGQRLEIESGTLEFTGPLDDPLINVRATRQIDGRDGQVVAGINLTGRAQNLGSTLFSEPSMAEAEVLSYLLLGRPLDQASSAEGGILASSAYALGLRQTALITNQIGQVVGLDELVIRGSDQNSTELIAGKQIHSRVYASFGYGVFSRIGHLLMRIKLTDKISVEVDAGEAQSMDILYTIEKY